MIGHALWRGFAGSAHEVFGTLHTSSDRFAHYGLFGQRVIEGFEAANLEQVKMTLEEINPDIIINCIGITKRKSEANDLRLMFEVNALFPHRLAGWAQGRARVIHFSTDCVFGGENGKYHERSVMTAADLYGQTKYFGELDYDHCLTIRTSMIGREIAGFSELLEWFLAQRGKQIKGFTNALYSGMTTLTMASLVPRIIERHPNLNGRYQIAGPLISKHDLLSQLRDAFALDISIKPDDSFYCDRTLQSRKFAEATGIAVPGWPEMIAGLAHDRTFYDSKR